MFTCGEIAVCPMKRFAASVNIVKRLREGAEFHKNAPTWIAPYHAMVFNPGTASKCASRVANGKSCCFATAAIQ